VSVRTSRGAEHCFCTDHYDVHHLIR